MQGKKPINAATVIGLSHKMGILLCILGHTLEINLINVKLQSYYFKSCMFCGSGIVSFMSDYVHSNIPATSNIELSINRMALC